MIRPRTGRLVLRLVVVSVIRDSVVPGAGTCVALLVVFTSCLVLLEYGGSGVVIEACASFVRSIAMAMLHADWRADIRFWGSEEKAFCSSSSMRSSTAR